MKQSILPKTRFGFVMIWLALLLTGCWDRKEVNDLSMITAAGIDWSDEDKKFELSVQVFVPRSEAGGKEGISGGGLSSSGQTFTRSAEGITVADAMMKLQEKLPRQIFWGHNEVFIFGEQLAKKGVRRHLDFLVRHPQVRESSVAFVSKDRAKKVLKLLPPLERSSSEVLRELTKSGISLKVTLKDLMKQMSGDEQAAGLPWVEILPPDPEKSKNETIPFITGTAVFKRDKLVGHIDDSLTRGLLWMRNEIRNAVITVSPEPEDGFVSLKLIHANSELIPSIENGKWKITLETMSEDDIIQSETRLDMMNPVHVKMLEKSIEKDIENRVKDALELAQKKMNADIFGFAQTFHRKYPKQWNKVKNRWDEVFPEIEVSFDIKVRVRRNGVATSPVGLPKDEVEE